MKRVVILCSLLALFLSGCNQKEGGVGQALKLRNRIISAQSCTFSCCITADYSDNVYFFSMNCEFNENGDMVFSVTGPESIAGICGEMNSVQGHLTFDEHALAFPQIADGYISPVTAPWLFMNALRGGYITACTDNEKDLYIVIDDVYEAETLNLQIWTDADFSKAECEFFWKGKRILSVELGNISFG